MEILDLSQYKNIDEVPDEVMDEYFAESKKIFARIRENNRKTRESSENNGNNDANQ